MAVCNLRDLKALLPPGGRLIGLDLGEKTIGMAVSDPGLSLASPIGTIRRTKFTPDAKELLRIVDDRGVAGLVIGLPVNMDGSEGPRCQSVRAFARDLLKLRDLPIAFWDERLSTMAVQRQMIDFDVTRKKRAKAVDTAAAAWILQGALDALRFGG
ncbi:Holliday junction resolvase RuvX [Inquilinus limosus]|uniref:Holliday junction resolvase RuvX n=1 Tax=Inquilinus limosus TaxID=171674 RepID=UPI000429FCAB|nr:Holliday junction resolvase RuvX [Inquilinus limosus]